MKLLIFFSLLDSFQVKLILSYFHEIVSINLTTTVDKQYFSRFYKVAFTKEGGAGLLFERIESLPSKFFPSKERHFRRVDARYRIRGWGRAHRHVTANIYVLSGKSAAVESAGWKLDENKLESREMDRGNRVKFSPVSG